MRRNGRFAKLGLGLGLQILDARVVLAADETLKVWGHGGARVRGRLATAAEVGVDGPNATLIRGDVVAFVRDLKATVEGELDVAGPVLAGAIAPLIDEYRLYFRPYVLGGGKPYFAGARPPLRLVGTNRIGDDVVQLIYVPA